MIASRYVIIAAALAVSTSFAVAQPSQPQGGAATGPTSNSQNSESSVPSTVGPGPATASPGVATGTAAPVVGEPNPVVRSTGAPAPNAAISRPPGDAAAPAGR